MRRVLTALAVAGGLMAATVTPAHAIASFGPISTVINPACDFDGVRGDAVVNSTGTVRGFAVFGGDDCGGFNPRIRYFQGKAASWTSSLTPYRGVVLAATHDTTGVYLLWAATDGVRLAKRRYDGTWAFNRQLSPKGLGGAVTPTGDVVARSGKWWAVWTEQVGAGGEFAQQEIFQSTTFRSTPLYRNRITYAGDDDLEPTITLRPEGAGGFLAWTRNDGAAGLASAVRVARAPMSAVWTAKKLSDEASSPDLTTRGSRIYLGYERSARITMSNDPWNAAVTRYFAAAGAGYRPQVSVTTGHVFMAWMTPTAPNHVVVGDLVGTTLTRSNITAGVASDQQLIRLLSSDGKATALVASFGSHRLWARSQA